MWKGESHVSLDFSFQPHPNMAIFVQEVSTSNMTLSQVTNCICDIGQACTEKGKYLFAIVLSKYLIKNILAIQLLMQEIKGLLKEGISTKMFPSLLSRWSTIMLKSLPIFIQNKTSTSKNNNLHWDINFRMILLQHLY